MAATAAQITAHAQAIIAAANLLKQAKILCQEVSDYNSVNDPGWNSLNTDVDGNGVVSGTNAHATDISAAIGSINNFLAFWSGSAQVAQSAWGQNIEKIASAIVTQ